MGDREVKVYFADSRGIENFSIILRSPFQCSTPFIEVYINSEGNTL